MVTVTQLRRCFLGLAAAGIVGTGVELALTRHWNSAVQLIPWLALGILAVALGLVVARPGPKAVRAARVLVVLVVVTAAFGVFEHVLANYDAGPLDFRYASTWATMTATSRWWAAFTESVGPSPTLAPGVLAQAGACVLFATLGHPALTSGTAARVQRTRSRAKASSRN